MSAGPSTRIANLEHQVRTLDNQRVVRSYCDYRNLLLVQLQSASAIPLCPKTAIMPRRGMIAVFGHNGSYLPPVFRALFSSARAPASVLARP
jgi:hypothetical protein